MIFLLFLFCRQHHYRHHHYHHNYHHHQHHISNSNSYLMVLLYRNCSYKKVPPLLVKRYLYHFYTIKFSFNSFDFVSIVFLLPFFHSFTNTFYYEVHTICYVLCITSSTFISFTFLKFFVFFIFPGTTPPYKHLTPFLSI